MSNKNTIFQDLTKLLTASSGFDATRNKKSDKKIIIKGETPRDIERKALELSQKKTIEDRFFGNLDNNLQKTMQYEAARLPAYMDFEGMEYYPIIGSALDLYMEEATNIDDYGNMLKIFSNNKRVKESLTHLFDDVVNINVNLPFWVRSLVKYGDNFVNINGSKKLGVTHVRQMVNYDIDRLETYNDGVPTIKFKNRNTGDVYNVFEVLHFRLLGDSKFLPYGSSLLNKVRRVFRQCIMAEDAMLTYRLIRSGDRRVYKIDVGNMDIDDVDEYIMNIATKYTRKQSVNSVDGQIDYRFNIMGYDEDIYIPVRNSNSSIGVDTLEGFKDNGIHDIEYLRDNLFTGLSIPKPFLGFQQNAGDGKSLAQFDIRFAKKIIRVQQAIIQELNKLATIHLYYQGFSVEEINSFKLTLNNPSTQEKMLRIELLKSMSDLYSDLTKTDGGIAIMSHTRAKKMLFDMTNQDIILDLKQQRIERAVAFEFENTANVIKNTGIFTDLDNKFKGKNINVENPNNEEGGDDNQQSDIDNNNMGDEDNTDNEFQSVSDLPEPTGANDTESISDSYVRFDNLLNELFSYDIVKEEVKEPSKIIYRNNIENTKQLISEIDDIVADNKLLESDEDLDIDNIIVE